MSVINHKYLKMSAEHSQVIDKFGGTTAVAAICEVTPQAVSKWKRHGIPKSRIKYLRLLRPENFKNVNKQAVNE